MSSQGKRIKNRDRLSSEVAISFDAFALCRSRLRQLLPENLVPSSRKYFQ